jgi:chemotaxis protein methyltransferase CheR
MAKEALNPHVFEFEFTDEDFNYITKMVHDKTGISIQPHKKTMVYSRIAKRIRLLGLKSFKEYTNFLSSPDVGNELVDFVNALTTNLTKFFREMHHFEHLKKVSIPDRCAQSSSDKRLRIWSAGCSAGMEPYSIAMTLRDAMPNVDSWNAKILATDIDTNVLNTGINGEYKIEELENIPKKYQDEYLKTNTTSGKIMMSQKIKGLISFKQLNLMEPLPMKGPFDIIFCRNVVIYFNKDTQKVLFNKYADILADGGYLYIGHSESLHNVSNRFQLIDKTTYRKIR